MSPTLRVSWTRALSVALLGILAVSCSSVRPAEVLIVREQKDLPGGRCESMGRIASDAAAGSAQVETELRDRAARRGANMVLLGADPSATRGEAYSCGNRNPGEARWGTANGADGQYGPQTPVVDRDKDSVTPRPN